MNTHSSFDGPVIVGAGLAGLSAALAAARTRKVLVLSGPALGHGCSSAWAQGGMAAALSPDDAPALHAADTMAAGSGLCDAAAVRVLTGEGPGAVRRLAALGAPFDRDESGAMIQSLEAAHSRPRVARVGGDGAGAAIMAAVIAAARASPDITLREGIRVRALLHDRKGRVSAVLAQGPEGLSVIGCPAVVLATGGVGGLYAVTTNPREVRGQGLALALAAGATIADPEFVQFHPTAIDVGQDPAPLATEALRGEGAILRDADGLAFMARYDPRAELAPRDIVARAIQVQIAAGKGAFLDATAAIGAHFPTEFPAVFAACMAAGIDPRVATIPVAPAAHYHMGGVVTDLEGRTSVEGLYAAGECASTGVHGANRLASNSLLEAAVFGTRAGDAAARETAKGPPLPAAPLAELSADALQPLRAGMGRHAGVVRDADGLATLIASIDHTDRTHGVTSETTVMRLIAQSALARRESLGAHARSDFPQTPTAPARTLVVAPSLCAAE